MNLVPYVNPDDLTKRRNEILSAAKGRQLTLTEAFEIKNLQRGVDISQRVMVFKMADDSRTSIEELIAQYLEEKTGLGTEFMRVQADKMAVRLFIPVKVYTDLTSRGISIPSEEVQEPLKSCGVEHITRFILRINDEEWMPIISTYARLFLENKLREFDWWIREIRKIRDKYLQLTQPMLPSGDIAHENKTDKAQDN